MIISDSSNYNYSISTYEDGIYIPIEIILEGFLAYETITIEYKSHNGSFVELSFCKETGILYNISFINIHDSVSQNSTFLNNLTSYGKEKSLLRLTCVDVKNMQNLQLLDKGLSLYQVSSNTLVICFDYLGTPSYYSVNKFENGLDYLIEAEGNVIGLILKFKDIIIWNDFK
ncbi:hypothetical protein BST97_05315 [Nonlabens spongiae]|uniref:Uncharacterized protein n=1 Tax=Nonlabens spongiae TaxID=331648 RepID=A0A1W6MJ10_9FLAO|nr:hypothetical protein [Nonlabens spongiae]ARN77449.1 hypothetical protein BST97_05315 [Nonlabens spongiae]